MNPISRLAVGTVLILLLGSCDANRDLRNRVETLAAEASAQRMNCDQARDQEGSAREHRNSLRSELSTLRAGKQWDDVAKSGDAGTQEQLIQAQKTMEDPGRESARQLDIERLQRELKLAEQDDTSLRERRKAACDAMLRSNDALLAAKKSLEQAETASKR